MPVRAPVTKLREASRKAGEPGPDIGRQARSADREAEGPPDTSQGTERPRVGESGVGSNAGPICYWKRVGLGPIFSFLFRVAARKPVVARPDQAHFAIISPHLPGGSCLSSTAPAMNRCGDLPSVRLAIYLRRDADGKSHKWP